MSTAKTPETRAAAGDQPMVELRGVHKWYAKFQVLKDINLTVAKG